MRRIARPVAGRNHPLADVEVFAVELLVEDDLRGTRPVVLSERDVARVLRANERGLRGVARDWRAVVRELDVRQRGDRVLRAAREIQAVGLAGERRLAPVSHLERPAVARRGKIAAHEDERDFRLARVAFVDASLRELQKPELRELHSILADVEYLVVAFLGLKRDPKIHVSPF